MANVSQFCRICFNSSVKMFSLKNTNMEHLFKLLTQICLDMEDCKPAIVCFLCYARLRQCERLQQQAVKSDKLLEEILKGRYMQTTINNESTRQDLQVSPIYHIDLEPATCKDVFPKTEADSLILVEGAEVMDEGHNMTENLCVIQQENGVRNYPHSSNSIQIQKKDNASYNNEQTQEIKVKSKTYKKKKKNTFVTNEPKVQKLNNNNVDAVVDNKSEKKRENTKKIVVIKQKIRKSIHYKDTQKDNINSPKTSVKNTTIDELQCNQFSKQFTTKDIRTDNIFKCIKTTEISVSDSPLMKANVLKSLQSEIYRCENCSFKTSSKRFLDYHLKMHNITKVFICNICEYRCDCKSRLINHMIKHTGEKSFCCNICEYRCAYKHQLKLHVIKHSGEKPFSCNICEYRTAIKFDLKRHIRIHSDEKPFTCNICEHKSRRKSDLKIHMTKHTGYKPFYCNICLYRCAAKCNLSRHMLKHTAKKLFSCNICEYKCKRKAQLNYHIMTHSDRIPLTRDILKDRYARKVYFNRKH